MIRNVKKSWLKNGRIFRLTKRLLKKRSLLSNGFTWIWLRSLGVVVNLLPWERIFMRNIRKTLPVVLLLQVECFSILEFVTYENLNVLKQKFWIVMMMWAGCYLSGRFRSVAISYMPT